MATFYADGLANRRSLLKKLSKGRKGRIYFFEIDKENNIYKIGITSNLYRRKKTLRATKIMSKSDRIDYAYGLYLEYRVIKEFSKHFLKVKNKKEYFYIPNDMVNNCIDYIKNLN